MEDDLFWKLLRRMAKRVGVRWEEHPDQPHYSLIAKSGEAGSFFSAKKAAAFLKPYLRAKKHKL